MPSFGSKATPDAVVNYLGKGGTPQVAPLMKLNPLSDTGHPDFHLSVIHFTGRSGKSHRPPEIEAFSDLQRLASILLESRIRAYPMFGTGERAVCFTESTRAGKAWLVRQRLYTPCAIAFTKAAAFARGAGPALYIRGDEWDGVQAMPAKLKARAVRLWPGAEADPGEDLPWYLGNRSEWLAEREWRAVPAEDGMWSFSLDDVSGLVVPDAAIVEWLAGWLDANGAPDRASRVRSLTYEVMTPDGVTIGAGNLPAH